MCDACVTSQGVMSSRVTSVLVALDKIKLVLRHPGQLQTPPLRLLTDAEVVSHLWTGERSVIRRAVAVRVCTCRSGKVE